MSSTRTDKKNVPEKNHKVKHQKKTNNESRYEKCKWIEGLIGKRDPIKKGKEQRS